MKSIELTKKMIITGSDVNFYSTETFDTILALGKMFIYRQKINSQTLSIMAFIKEVKNRHDSEKYNAALHFEQNKHITRWSPFTPLFDY